jgi:hypothetical protein
VGKFVLSRGGVLGERAATDAEHLVAGLEPGHVGADRNDRAGHVQSGDWVLRTTQAKAHDPHQVRLARHDVPGAAIHPGGTHL